MKLSKTQLSSVKSKISFRADYFSCLKTMVDINCMNIVFNSITLTHKTIFERVYLPIWLKFTIFNDKN
jgi:hypothetical protein